MSKHYDEWRRNLRQERLNLAGSRTDKDAVESRRELIRTEHWYEDDHANSKWTFACLACVLMPPALLVVVPLWIADAKQLISIFHRSPQMEKDDERWVEYGGTRRVRC
jgi:hypothetical protein